MNNLASNVADYFIKRANGTGTIFGTALGAGLTYGLPFAGLDPATAAMIGTLGYAFGNYIATHYLMQFKIAQELEKAGQAVVALAPRVESAGAPELKNQTRADIEQPTHKLNG